MHTESDKKSIKYAKSGNCLRCSSQGYINIYHHVMNGICFECYGSGDSRNPSSCTKTVNSQKSLKRRWFIGLLDKGNGPEPIINFTENEIDVGILRIDRQLVSMGINIEPRPESFKLIIGEPGEDKKTLLLRHLETN